MNQHFARFFAATIGFSTCYCVEIAQAQSQTEDLEKLYGDEDFVSIATGTKQPISKAPAVASVITADQIKAMGATNLDEVLETVPGLHVSRSSLRLSPIYSIRGIYTDINPQVLVLIDGVPMTQVYTGDRGARSTLPVENISRVEVIRGPGSAIYGADAFAGVINVITKPAAEIRGTKVGVRAGSFDTEQAWLLHGSQWKGVNVAFTMEWRHTNGDSGRIISADAQSAFDSAINSQLSIPAASLAPGPLDTQQNRVDLHLDLSNRNWRFHIWNWRQYNMGVGPGLALALDPSGRVDTNNYLSYLTYNASPSQDWDVTAKASYMYVDFQSQQDLFPPGTVLPIGSNGNVNPTSPAGLVSFPDGLLGNPNGIEHHAMLDLYSFYKGFNRHRIRLGAGIAYANLDPSETKNYGPGVLNGTEGTVNGSLTDVTGTPYIYIKSKSRTVYYGSIQDEWSMAPDWDLTAGVRYDHYSDFGSTINPRLALVWQTTYDLTTKLLYGRAFRAPSFSELFTINNPIRLGNPNLKPETINTYEIAFDYNPTFDVHTSINLFRYNINDLILGVPDNSGTTFTFQNAGAQDGYGLEWEADWQAARDLKLTANYAFQNSRNGNTHSDAGNAPHHEIYGRADWTFLPNWSLVPQVDWVGPRNRVAGDPRPPLGSYTMVDLTIRRTDIANHWEAAFIAQNLFNVDAREPSPFSEPAPAIPNDFPLPGIAFYGEVRYNF